MRAGPELLLLLLLLLLGLLCVCVCFCRPACLRFAKHGEDLSNARTWCPKDAALPQELAEVLADKRTHSRERQRFTKIALDNKRGLRARPPPPAPRPPRARALLTQVKSRGSAFLLPT